LAAVGGERLPVEEVLPLGAEHLDVLAKPRERMADVGPVEDVGPHVRPMGEAEDRSPAGELVEIGGGVGHLERTAATGGCDPGRVVYPRRRMRTGPWIMNGLRKNS
jgi:hypothetical protein